jgi:hypothetical protein
MAISFQNGQNSAIKELEEGRGGPGWISTSTLRVRIQVLYAIKLRSHYELMDGPPF